MKITIIYDSVHGNTEKIARSIGSSVNGDIQVLRVNEMNPSDIKSDNLYIIGCSTHGGRPTPAMRSFIDSIPENALKGINVVAFDTRLTTKLVKIFGYAAVRIESDLIAKGGRAIVPAEGFFVKGSEGPLKDGELERAAVWAKGIGKQ